MDRTNASPRLLVSILLLSGAPAAAQGFAVSSVSPARNVVGAPTATAISVTFTAPVNPATVSASSFQVRGRWSGKTQGTPVVGPGGLSIVFRPGRPFFPGELVTVSLSAAIAGAGGGNLAGGHTWSFWARSAPGSGSYALSSTLNVRRAGEGLIQTYGITAGDIEGDGSPDFSLANEVASDVRVFLNDGCGTLAGPALHPLPPGSVPSPIEAADLNGDGRTDLAVANISGDSLSILLGTGSGGFLPHVTYPSGDAPRGLALLDADGDGDLDAVTANRNSSNLALHLNAGNGTFLPRVLFEGGGNGETALAAADANNDGIADLFVGNYNSNTVSLLLGNGAAGFTVSGTGAAGGRPWMIGVGDVDRDGNMDVAAANSTTNNVSVVRGNGSGGLLPPANYPAGGFPIWVDLGDIDGDGDLDLVVSNYGGRSFTVLRNNGSGVFDSSFTLPAVSAGSGAQVVDLDRDGDADIAGIDEVADLLFLFRQAGPSPPGVQAPSCAATLRIDNLANRGGYGGAPPHRVPVTGSFFAGISGSPNAVYSLAVGFALEPGFPTALGILNLNLPFVFLLDGFGGNPNAVTNPHGEDVEAIAVPPGLPPGVTVAFQAVILAPGQPLDLALTNPERIELVP